MGLASKLAASQGQPASYPGQYQRAGQNQYQAYPGQPSQQYPGQYGSQQAPGGQGYGSSTPQYGQGGQYGAPAPGPAGPAQIAQYKQLLQNTIQEQKLSGFYPPNSPVLDQIAHRAAGQVDRLCAQWRIPKEVGNDIVKLALYDVILYIGKSFDSHEKPAGGRTLIREDDSGSMQFEENGERIKDLKLIMERVVFAAILFDDDGISIRFMNSQKMLDTQPSLLNNIRSEHQVNDIMSRVQFSGLTPMGTSLRQKVIEDVLSQARASQLRKPVLVITITDGQPAGEPQNTVAEAVRYAAQELGRIQRYGPGAISYQFAQVGNDQKAREFLGQLDSDPRIGSLIDCTSNYENESVEMSRANPPVDLTPELWLIKLLLGSIDSSYDAKDESSARPQGPPGHYDSGYPSQYGGGPQGQYSAPQQSPYGAPQGQYGAPSQGQYGGAPLGQYNPNQPSQGQFNTTQPGQGQYGGQPQGQYGRPPPPAPAGYQHQQNQGYPPAPPRY